MRDTRRSLLDRDAEIARLDAVLASPGGYAFVEGHAGIGKTRLLGAMQARARARDLAILSARGDELERAFSYGVVRQLLEGRLLLLKPDARAALLEGPAAHAARALGLAGDASALPDPDSPFSVVHALYLLLVRLAEQQPLLLVVDDLHWVDVPSLRLLDYLAGRLEGTGLWLVVAARPAEPGAPAELLTRLRDRHRPVLVRPGPLGADAAWALVAEVYSTVPDAAFAAACHRASAGNPLLLHELVDTLHADGVAPTIAAAGMVGELGPQTVARSLLLRLGALGPQAGQVVEAVAVLGGAAQVRHVAAVAGLAPETVAELADRLVDSNVLAPGRPLQFVHPVVREAIYGEMRFAARARLHAQAAALLLAEGHAADAVAPHLLMTEPAGDPVVVGTLRAAAAVAMRQGAADTAQTYLRRAVEEPAPVADRVDVLAELGRAELRAGVELAAAVEHLEAAVRQTEDPHLRAQRAQEAARAHLFLGDLDGAIALSASVQATVGAEDALTLLAHDAGLALIAPWLPTDAVARLEAWADVPGDTPAELAALAELGGARWLAGDIQAAADFAERALDGGRLLAAQGAASVAFNHAARVLLDADRFAVALPAIAAGIDASAAQGSLIGLSSLIACRAIGAWRRGDVAALEADSRRVLELQATSIVPVGEPAWWAALALALIERGELAEAADALAEERIGAEPPPLSYMGIVWLARARLALASGRAGDAVELLRALQDRDAQLGVRHLSTAWHPTAVRAALALGDVEQAGAFAAEQRARAERWTVASARGVTLATDGLVMGGEDGLVRLEEGVAVLADSPARLELARARLDLGGALRRTGRRAAAREVLGLAVEGARVCGATALEAAALEELRTAGARPRRRGFSGLDALTASERRVAERAAAGQSNREIAATLVVTVRTVENHLARVYRKLGIRSRGDLPSVLS